MASNSSLCVLFPPQVEEGDADEGEEDPQEDRSSSRASSRPDPVRRSPGNRRPHLRRQTTSQPLVSLEPAVTPMSTTRPEPTVPPANPPVAEPAAPAVAAEPEAQPEPEPDGHARPLPAIEALPLDEGTSQMTVAVPTLQPAAPYRGSENAAEGGDPAAPARRRGRNAVRKRAIKARKRSGAHEALGQPGTESEGEAEGGRRRRRRPVRFGQHVLGRLGGKD